MFYARHMEKLQCGKYFMRLHKETLENSLYMYSIEETQVGKFDTAMHRVLNSDVFVYYNAYIYCLYCLFLVFS